MSKLITLFLLFQNSLCGVSATLTHEWRVLEKPFFCADEQLRILPYRVEYANRDLCRQICDSQPDCVGITPIVDQCWLHFSNTATCQASDLEGPGGAGLCGVPGVFTGTIHESHPDSAVPYRCETRVPAAAPPAEEWGQRTGYMCVDDQGRYLTKYNFVGTTKDECRKQCDDRADCPGISWDATRNVCFVHYSSRATCNAATMPDGWNNLCHQNNGEYTGTIVGIDPNVAPFQKNWICESRRGYMCVDDQGRYLPKYNYVGTTKDECRKQCDARTECPGISWDVTRNVCFVHYSSKATCNAATMPDGWNNLCHQNNGEYTGTIVGIDPNVAPFHKNWICEDRADRAPQPWRELSGYVCGDDDEGLFPKYWKLGESKTRCRQLCDERPDCPGISWDSTRNLCYVHFSKKATCNAATMPSDYTGRCHRGNGKYVGTIRGDTREIHKNYRCEARAPADLADDGRRLKEVGRDTFLV